MRAFVVTQDRCNFYLLDVYANCDCDRDTEIEDPLPVQRYSLFYHGPKLLKCVKRQKRLKMKKT